MIHTGSWFFAKSLVSLLLRIFGCNRCKWLGTLKLLPESCGVTSSDCCGFIELKFSEALGVARWIHSNSISRASNCRPKWETVTPLNPVNTYLTTNLITEVQYKNSFLLSYQEIGLIILNPVPVDSYRYLQNFWFECMSSQNRPLSLQCALSPLALYNIFGY